MSSAQKLLIEIERFLKRHDMTPTAFSVQIGDRNFVRTFRLGRVPTMETADKARELMARINAAQREAKTAKRRSKGCSVAA